MPPGRVGEELVAAGVPLYSLDMQAGVPSPSALLRLRRLVSRLNPDIVVGWMHHAFLAATAAGLGRSSPPVVWNVRHSLHDIRREKPLTRAVLNLCAKLSGAPAAIIYNAAASKAQYSEFGFRNRRIRTIENGFDAGQFRPRSDARKILESAFGFSSDDFVIASVARCHAMKDPKTLIDAVGRLSRSGYKARLLLVGDGYESPPADILHEIDTSLPDKSAVLSGHRDDLANWLGGVDVFALSSAWGEGFPNVLGEALACGAPCVTTDVGDSAAVVAGAGHSVPPGDPGAFANALEDLAGMSREERRAIGQAGRARVLQHYAIDRIVERYSALYKEILSEDCAHVSSTAAAAGATP
jgi:glycosyltransferase involved in cell wall biosynthesis